MAVRSRGRHALRWHNQCGPKLFFPGPYPTHGTTHSTHGRRTCRSTPTYSRFADLRMEPSVRPLVLGFAHKTAAKTANLNSTNVQFRWLGRTTLARDTTRHSCDLQVNLSGRLRALGAATANQRRVLHTLYVGADSVSDNGLVLHASCRQLAARGFIVGGAVRNRCVWAVSRCAEQHGMGLP